MNDIIQFSFPIEYENIRIDKAVFDYLNGQEQKYKYKAKIIDNIFKTEDSGLQFVVSAHK